MAVRRHHDETRSSGCGLLINDVGRGALGEVALHIQTVFAESVNHGLKLRLRRRAFLVRALGER